MFTTTLTSERCFTPQWFCRCQFECSIQRDPVDLFLGDHCSVGSMSDGSMSDSDQYWAGLVRAFLTNRIKAQRHLADVMIETEAPFDIEYRDPNLEKILKLSPADLRFIDALIAKVEGSDETEWVGSDQWIR